MWPIHEAGDRIDPSAGKDAISEETALGATIIRQTGDEIDYSPDRDAISEENAHDAPAIRQAEDGTDPLAGRGAISEESTLGTFRSVKPGMRLTLPRTRMLSPRRVPFGAIRSLGNQHRQRSDCRRLRIKSAIPPKRRCRIRLPVEFTLTCLPDALFGEAPKNPRLLAKNRS